MGSSEPLTVEQRRDMLAESEREWLAGGDVILGTFLGDRVVGGCGLHHRIAPDGLEIGYWTHSLHTGRGFATQATALLTAAALALCDFTHVEIHHDKANIASAAVPAKLGFWLVDEFPDDPEAPNEIGIECRWRMDRDTWVSLRAASTEPTD